MKKKSFAILILAATVAVAVMSFKVFLFFSQKDNMSQAPLSYRTINVYIGQKVVDTQIADTPAAQALGLGGRAGISANAAMLFVFSESERYGFWMKDMRFSIDMIWLDENKNVVFIKDNVSPATFPEVFMPNAPARYVLEVNAGFAKENGVKIGSKINF